LGNGQLAGLRHHKEINVVNFAVAALHVDTRKIFVSAKTGDQFYPMCAIIFGPPVLKNRRTRSAAMARKIMFNTVV